MSIEQFFQSLSEDKVNELNRKQLESLKSEYSAFIDAFTNNECYMCGQKLNASPSNLCLHNLLYMNSPNKSIVNGTLARSGLFPTLTYLAWVANSDYQGVNIQKCINGDKKFECTLRWQSVVWSFSVAQSDFIGHSGTQTEFPHFHYEALKDEKIITNFSQLHIPLTGNDLFTLKSIDFLGNDATIFANDSMDLDDVEAIVENDSSYLRPSKYEESEFFRVQSIVQTNDGKPIDEQLIGEIHRLAETENILLAEAAKRLGLNVISEISATDKIKEMRKRK